MKIKLPDSVSEIIHRLNGAGYEAYAVGGCVRDSVMGLAPTDYDLTTSALPEQVKAVLPEKKIYDTGIKHGTVLVVNDGMRVEVTTFRIDGEYSDKRHPESVGFTTSLSEDLKRRDFTINALAYNENDGLIDLFGGVRDIEGGIIKCVGDAEKRFSEDALRIMRALRFASVFGFELERKTASAVHKKKELLTEISAERVADELNKLICGDCREILMRYADVFSVIIPEIIPCIGFEQHSEYHCYDVYEHTCAAVGVAENDKSIRLAVLLHDLGKPAAYSFYDGHGHFRGHGGISAELAETILRRLKYDRETVNEVTMLVKYHDVPVSPDRRLIKRQINRYGAKTLLKLIKVHIADDIGKASRYRGRIDGYRQAEEIARELIAGQACFSLKSLAVDGDDMIRLGYSGKEIGVVLNLLLGMVLDETCENCHDALLAQAVKYRQK